MHANWFLGFPVGVDHPINGWRSQLPVGCRPYLTEDLHVTFCFLGAPKCDVPKALQPVWEAMIRQAPKAFQLQIDHALALPKKERCSALALGFAPNLETMRLKAYMLSWRELLFEALNLKLDLGSRTPQRHDSREPLPHLTLARPPSGITAGLRAQMALQHSQSSFPSQTLCLNKLALYTWSDNREYQKFKIIQFFHLI